MATIHYYIDQAQIKKDSPARALCAKAIELLEKEDWHFLGKRVEGLSFYMDGHGLYIKCYDPPLALGFPSWVAEKGMPISGYSITDTYTGKLLSQTTPEFGTYARQDAEATVSHYGGGVIGNTGYVIKVSGKNYDSVTGLYREILDRFYTTSMLSQES